MKNKYSYNMTSFVGYINNLVIKRLIYFDWHMCIVRQIMHICDSMYLYRIVVYTTLKICFFSSHIHFLFYAFRIIALTKIMLSILTQYAIYSGFDVL